MCFYKLRLGRFAIAWLVAVLCGAAIQAQTWPPLASDSAAPSALPPSIAPTAQPGAPTAQPLRSTTQPAAPTAQSTAPAPAGGVAAAAATAAPSSSVANPLPLAAQAVGSAAPAVAPLPGIDAMAEGRVVASSFAEPVEPISNVQLLARLEAAEAELAQLRRGPQPSGWQSSGSQVPALNVSQLQDAPNSVVADQDTIQRLAALEQAAASNKEKLPLIRLSGFFQIDDAMINQSANNQAIFGDVFSGVGFRRTRLQALGNVAEFTRYSIEVDFAINGRPSFLDVWGEQTNLPFFGAVRIGHFRQPTTMDALTSIRHLDFLERNAGFQAMDPFRRDGIMAYRVSEDELSTLAYSVYATGFTFFNGAGTSYATIGDTRFATQIGDSGGVSFAIRGTHLLYYDEPAEGRYLLHVGGGYNFSEIGGEGTTGAYAKTYEARTIPEFFQGDGAGGGLTAAGTPFVLDTGRILSHSFNLFHTELAGNYGPAHFQTEFLATGLNQFDGPTVFYYGAYLQCGFFLTGESAGYNKQTGVMDYNVKPFTEFFGVGPNRGVCGWGAWEAAFRWSYLDLSDTNVRPANLLPGLPGPPPTPNPGILNESTVAINWWCNQYTRVQFNWIHSMIDNTLPGRGPSTMNTFATRFQVEF